MIALPDDDELHSNTEALIADPPDILVAHTGIGFRGWLAAAEGWGLANQLITALSSARIVSRGPKATGALRAAGLHEEWSPESESSQEVLRIPARRRVCRDCASPSSCTAPPTRGTRSRNSSAGCVSRAPKWCPSGCTGGSRHHWAAISISWSPGSRARQFDAVTFTSAPAAAAVLERSRELGIEDQVLGALRTDVHAMCVGPVTSKPLIRKGVPTSAPERMRLGALARHIAEELPLLGSCTVKVAGHTVDIRGTCVLVDGSIKLLSPSGMSMLRALAQRPGDVVARTDLLRVLPGNSNDPHAVDTAVLRLRTALGDKNIIATMVKRGYRLAVDDPPDGPWT